MQVRHDVSLLKQAVEHVVARAALPVREAEAAAAAQKAAAAAAESAAWQEAESAIARERAAAEAQHAEAHARAVARRRLATGAAIGVAAVGIGLGLYLGLWAEPAVPERPRVAEAPPAEPVRPAPPEPPARSEPPPEPTVTRPAPPVPSPSPTPQPEVVTVDFTKFGNTTVQLLGREWELQAGHYFESETDEQWQVAWCYTTARVDGVAVKVDLVERDTPTARPRALVSTPQTLAQAGLDDVAALALATRCPWLDAKAYAPPDFDFPPGRASPLAERPAALKLEGRTLVADGFIGDGLLARMQAFDFDRLRITSAGGLVGEGIRIGEWLRGAGKSVEAQGECLSSCVFVLAGGVERLAPADAHIGVHRFYSTTGPDAADLEIGQAISSRILGYLEAGGIDSALFHKMAAVPAADMALIDHATLRRWRLLTGAPGEAAALAPGVPVFAGRPGVDAMGGDLPGMPLRDVDQAGCEAACAGEPACRAYVFNTRYAACFLKSAADVLIRDPIAVSAWRTDLGIRPSTSDLEIRVGTAIEGTPLGPARGRRYVDCVRICDGSPDCRGFSHDSRTNACTLFGSIRRLAPSGNQSSGVKG